MPTTIDLFDWQRLGEFHALEALLRARGADAARALVVLGKTEGTATLNDFSREVAMAGASSAIEAVGGPDLLARTTSLFSTGCEGLASPFGMLLTIPSEGSRSQGGLAVGIARTAPLPPLLRGGAEHAQHVAAGVTAAITDAGLSAADVALVLVKSPVCPADLPDANPARAGSTGAARAAGALGAALALGDITATALNSAEPLARCTLHGTRCMAFSGTELDHDEIVVLGNRPGAGGLRIASTPLADALDVGAMRRLAAGLGARWDADGVPVRGTMPKAMFLKLGAPPGGRLRGARTTVLSSDLTPDKHLRAAASGIAGALFGTTRIFVSGGAEGQAPPGGGLFAAIAETPA